MTNTIKLYRTISWKELGVLLTYGCVNGEFNREHQYTTYKKELGKVVCGFIEPRHYFDGGNELVIEITVDRNDSVGEGVGTYEMYDPYDRVLERIVLKEVYLAQYTIDQVKLLRYPGKESMVYEVQNHLGMEVQETELPEVIVMPNYANEVGIHLLMQYDNKGTDVIEYAITDNAPTPEFAKNREEFKVETKGFEALLNS